jgi:hypothetical protein
MSTDALRGYHLECELRCERLWYFPVGLEGELRQLGSYLKRAAKRRVERLNGGETIHQVLSQRRPWKSEYGWKYRDTHREQQKKRSKLKYHRRRASGYVMQRDPFKEPARRVLRNAIATGKISKPSICPLCGRKAILQGHHRDYTKPLDVEWLCSVCHGKEHRKR